MHIALTYNSTAIAQVKIKPNLMIMDSQNLENKINQITNDYVSKREKVALTIGVIQQGHHYTKGLGQVSDHSCSLPDDQTIYEIGSVTKVFTGTVLAALVHGGTVALDDLIQLYLPQEVVSQLPTSVQSITLRQLATHTSGLPKLPDSFLTNIKDPTNPYLGYAASEMYAALVGLTLLSEPGQRYEYSNFGMGLLGHLLSLKTSQPYEDLVKGIICQPLGMTNTTIHLTLEQQSRFTPGHSPDGTLTSNWGFDVMAPAGAFRSTAEDLVMFLQAHLCESDPQRAAILARSQARYFEMGDTLSIGLAWHISTLPNGQVVHWHNGGTGGYVSFIGFDRAKQTGIVILSNYGDAFANDSSVDEMAIRILIELSSP
ncbi:serine hydrolase domain-containing protein [Phormidesmis sp. 146-33]